VTEKIAKTERPFHVKLSRQDRAKLDSMANSLQVDRSVVLRTLIRSAQLSTPRINVEMGQLQGV
jgi:hypothetical protein